MKLLYLVTVVIVLAVAHRMAGWLGVGAIAVLLLYITNLLRRENLL